MNKYVPGTGNPHAKIVFIGEAPSYEEEVAEEPFKGPAGRIFDDCLKNAGIKRSEVWITNVFKKMIMPQVKQGKKIPAFVRARQAGLDVEESIAHLRTELDDIRPNVIVPLGGTALYALRGTEKIVSWRGSILPAWNYKIVPTFHPAAIIHGEEAGLYWWKYIIEFDFKRAKAQSEFPEIILPQRNLHVCRNSAELWDFYERAKERSKRLQRPIKLAVDIEAIHCIPVCISLSFDKSEGICVPLWNKTSIIKISEIPSSDLASIWQLLYEILSDPIFLIVGQNFKYDQDKITRLGFRIPKLFSDTMLKAFAIDPEFSVGLAFNTSIYTEEPYYKDEGLEFDYRKHPIDDLLYYGAKDAPVTLEIDDAMDPIIDEIGQREFYENFLMQLHPLYLDIENTGMWQNITIRDELLRKYIAWSEKLKFERWKLTGVHANVNSHTKDMPILLYEMLKLPRRQGTGEDVLTALLPIVKKEEHRQVINNILDERRIEKQIGSYMMAKADFDGRMKTSYFLCLKTGRTSTGLLDPPIRPQEEYRDSADNKKKKKSIGAAFQVFTKHGDIGNDIRKQYEPDKGHVFINLDSSQAEARVIALLCNDDKMLAMYDTNDVHALTVSWFLGGGEEKYSKRILGYECPERFLGKTLRHSGHLGASPRRATLECNTSIRKYRINLKPISEAFSNIALKTFHAKSPAIRGVFHNGVQEIVNQTRVLIAPVPYGVEAKYGGRRTFYERYGDELFREAYSYLPQRAVSDNTKAAAIRSRKLIKGLRIAVESHDSLTLMVLEKDVDEYAAIVKQEMERPISFENCSLPRKSLTIPCEVEVGYNYCDFKKYKVTI